MYPTTESVCFYSIIFMLFTYYITSGYGCDSMSVSEISPEIMELIRVQMSNLEREIPYYTVLYDCIIDEDDKRLVEDIIISKRKHIFMLKELDYRLTGKRAANNEDNGNIPAGETPSENLTAEFRKGALAELENSETYRSLLFDFLNRSIRDSFIEIITDSQNNAFKFGILLSKYS